MTLIETLINKAKKNPKRVALPECESDKTLLAARRVLDEGVGIPVLVSDPATIRETAGRTGVSLEGMELIDTADESFQGEVAAKYMGYEKRKLTYEEVCDKIKAPMAYAMILEAAGYVDCTFCGHVHTTKDVLITASRCIGMQEGVEKASIFALAEIPGFAGSEGNVLALADCALIPEPSAGDLSSIAIATADNVRALMGWEPRIAFLSFSTDGSGQSPSVERIREAVRITRERRADLKADGEFQLDAAVVPEVAGKKLSRESEVAGKANILIFPDLAAANIGIKMIQLFAKGKGYGHLLSGFYKPVSDSSRSASVEEMVGDIAMAVIAAD